MTTKKRSVAAGTKKTHPNVTSTCRYIDARRRTVIPAAALEAAGIPVGSVMEWKSVNGCVVGSPVIGTSTINVETGRIIKKGV